MAFCANCGTQVSDVAVSCPECGHPTGRGAVSRAGTRTEGNAIAALVLGIAGFVVCPVICHILAIVLGNQARNRIRANPTLEGEGMARAGVILGWIGLGLAAVAIVIWIIAFVVASSSSSYGLSVI